MKKLFTFLLALVVSVGTSFSAITVRLNPYSCSSWSTVYLFAWTDNGAAPCGQWPGTEVSQDKEFWYSYTFDESYKKVNIIWTNGTDQTIDITGVTESTCYSLDSQSGYQITVSVVDCPKDKILIGKIYYELDPSNLTAAVTYALDHVYSGNVVIPASVTYNSKTYNVTSIGDYAFDDCSNLTSVTIPNSITSIEIMAFNRCSGLTTLTIPNSVTSIRDGAFYECSNLKSINIPNGVTSIRGGTFYKCHSLTSVVIPNGVIEIEGDAFYECRNLTSITIPDGVPEIGRYAFYGCSGLTSVTIGSGVVSIGKKAFYDCSSLTSIICKATVPPSCEEDEVFKYVTKSIPLYVPEASIVYYRIAPTWSEFTNTHPLSEIMEGIEDVNESVNLEGTHKIFRDGQIFILRGDRVYTLQGQQIK